MKTYQNLLSKVLSAVLLTTLLIGCQKEKLPEANPMLSYPAGEVALGVESYTSARPSVRSFSTPTFALIGVTHNGQASATSEVIASISPSTGQITMTPGTSMDATGVYLVSVRMTNNEGATDYADAFRFVVKGLVFEPGVTTLGVAQSFPIKESHLVQTEGSLYKLIPPANDINDDYKHFSIDAQSGTVNVDDQIQAGVYSISIQVTNRTNPKGTTFKDVLAVIVESKPYDLKYTPAEVTLMVKEGHTSPKPTFRGATAADGDKTTFALIDNFEFFEIDPATGIITLPKGKVLADQTLKSYSLQVKATNTLGSASFPDAYVVKVDPTKTAEPISSVTYPSVAFPVTLDAGQEWNSGAPVTLGATIDLAYSLIDAPQGVSINPETGIITFAKNHHMPLKTADNKLKVQAINIAMNTPYETLIGDFSVSVPEPLWTIKFHTIPSSADAVINSGITNMDRYSFMGKIQNNQNTDKPASTPVVKNAFGRAFVSPNQAEMLDYSGVNTANTWAGNANQNNDWMVSAELTLPTIDATFLDPFLQFSLAFQYGTDVQNCLEVYAIEINATNVYTKGEQNQDTKGLTATPSDLAWVALATTDKTNAEIPTKIAIKTSSLTNFADASIDLSQFKGKTIRLAFRSWNPSADNNNSRTWRIQGLRIQQDLPLPIE